jgi:hypothetical protein
MRHLKYERLLMIERYVNTTIPDAEIVTTSRSASGNKMSMTPGSDARTHFSSKHAARLCSSTKHAK